MVGPVGSPDPRDGHEHRAELRRRSLRARTVALVDDHDVRDLEEARLDRLDLVPHLGRLEDDGRVGRGRDLDLALAGSDRLEEHEIEPARVHHRCGGRRCGGEPASVAPRGHRSDEHVSVGGIPLHPDAVAEQRTTGDRARRIHGDDADRPAGLAGPPR